MPRTVKSKSRDRVGELIAEVEAAAKQLRKDVSKRAKATGAELKKTARKLSKRAATVAGLVEKQVHQLRKDLEKSAKASQAKRSKPKRNPSRRKA